MPVTIRQSRLGDEPDLKHIWKTVFGDSDEYINSFFSKMYSVGRAVLAEVGGEIVSAAYLLDLGTLHIPGVPPLPCSVLYALGTLPEHRGKGLGSKVADGILSLSRSLSFSADTICPAEKSLFEYYKHNFGYKPFFSAKETALSKGDLSRFENACDLNIGFAEPSSYGAAREALLEQSHVPHIKFSSKCLDYQHGLCLNSGGNMFVLDMNGVPFGCAAAEVYENTVFVKELILKDFTLFTAASARFPALFPNCEKFVFRTPSYPGADGEKSISRPFAMLISKNIKESFNISDTDTLPWYGFAFD